MRIKLFLITDFRGFKIRSCDYHFKKWAQFQLLLTKKAMSNYRICIELKYPTETKTWGFDLIEKQQNILIVLLRDGGDELQVDLPEDDQMFEQTPVELVRLFRNEPANRQKKRINKNLMDVKFRNFKLLTCFQDQQLSIVWTPGKHWKVFKFR
jgi:hypothetical protein